MTMVIPLGWQVLDANGDPYSGAKAQFYATGTTTPQATYSDSSLDIAFINANPLVADAAGRFGPAYGPTTTDYKVVLMTSADVVIATYDPVQMTGAVGALTVDTAQLADGAVANAKLDDMPTATIKGRATAGTGVPEDLTAAQTFGLINQMTEDTSPNPSADYIATYDASGATGKKVALARAGAVLISTFTGGGTSYDFTAFNATLYAGYWLELENVLPATDGAGLRLTVSTDGGSSFIGTGTYLNTVLVVQGSASPSTSTTATALSLADSIDSTTGNGVSGWVNIMAGGAVVNGTKSTSMLHYQDNAANSTLFIAAGSNTTSSQVNAFRLAMSSGNITSGTVRVYGIPK